MLLLHFWLDANLHLVALYLYMWNNNKAESKSKKKKSALKSLFYGFNNEIDETKHPY